MRSYTKRGNHTMCLISFGFDRNISRSITVRSKGEEGLKTIKDKRDKTDDPPIKSNPTSPSFPYPQYFTWDGFLSFLI